MQFSQLSPDLEEMLLRASFEATELGHELREPGHLILAMISQSDSSAGCTLNALGMTKDNVRPIVHAMYASHPSPQHIVEVFSKESYDAITAAIRIAKQDSQYNVLAKPHHLLKALIESEDRCTLTVLETLGVAKEDILRRLYYEMVNSKN
jgi:ATP-dependent Clp protease ATP-binding subunit ClpA